MRYTLDETIYLVEEFTTGDTVTIALYKISDSSTIALISADCIEVGSTGIFKWDTSKLAVQPTVMTEYLWIMSNGSITRSGQIVMGGYPDDISYTEKWIYINTEAAINGNGKSSSPFNNVSDAVDFAESIGWFKLLFLSDATLERTLKNFTIEGIGLPTIDFNDQDVNKSEFLKVKLTGEQVGSVTCREVVLLPGISNLNGIYKECGIISGGIYTVADGGVVALTTVSTLPSGFTPAAPTFDFGEFTTAAVLSIRRWAGSIKLINVNTPTKLASLHFAGGKIVIDSSCSDGDIRVVNLLDPSIIDNSTGSEVTRINNFPSVETIMEYNRDA